MIMKIENGKYDDKTQNYIVENLKDQKIIIMPSDTIYGFICIPEKENELRKIKNRDDKPFLFLIDDLKKLEYFEIEFYDKLDILSRNWPGPFTFIMKNKNGLHFGIRMPDWNVMLDIVKKIDCPLISTSVNLSGMTSINNISEIIKLFENKVDLIIDDTCFKYDIASTIVDITTDEIKVVRQGSRVLK